MGELVIPVEADTTYAVTAEIEYRAVPPDTERLRQALVGFRRFMDLYADDMVKSFRLIAAAFARLSGHDPRRERLRRMHEAYRRRH